MTWSLPQTPVIFSSPQTASTYSYPHEHFGGANLDVSFLAPSGTLIRRLAFNVDFTLNTTGRAPNGSTLTLLAAVPTSDAVLRVQRDTNPTSDRTPIVGLEPEAVQDDRHAAALFEVQAGVAALGVRIDAIEPGTGGGSTVVAEAIPKFETVAAAKLASIPAASRQIETLGYASANDGGGSRYSERSADPATTSSFQTVDGRFWDLTGPTINPLMFPGHPTDAADPSHDRLRIQNAFDFAATEAAAQECDLRVADWTIDQTVTWAAGAACTLIGGKIMAGAVMTDMFDVTIASARIEGVLHLLGGPFAAVSSLLDYTTRLATNGLRLTQGANFHIEHLKVDGVRRYGCAANNQQSNFANFVYADFDACGSEVKSDLDRGTLSATVTARLDSGSAFAQRSTLTITETAVLADLAMGDVMRFGGRVGLITAIGVDSVSVYPLMPTGVTTGQIDFFSGGGMDTEGNDANAFVIDRLEALRCGVAFRHGSIYGPSIQQLGAERCALGLQLNGNTSGNVNETSGRALSVQRLYTENCEVNILSIGQGAISANIGNSGPNSLADFDWTKVIRLGRDDGAGNLIDTCLEGVMFTFGGRHYSCNAKGAPSPINSISNSPSGVVLTNEPGENIEVFRRPASGGVLGSRVLKWEPDFWRLFAHNASSIEVRVFSGGPPAAINGTLTFTLDPDDETAGYTINGATSLVIAAKSNPYTVRFDMDVGSQNWIATIIDQPLAA